ncbi:MAG: amidohydrolase family protein [Actinomycetota bacterium]|nr:amidohydrolase family protein [Actinomycetota bacterium]
MRELVGRMVAGGRTVAMSVSHGVVVDVVPVDDAASEGRWIAPGLVDLQVNGSAGVDLNGDDITVERVGELVEQQRGAGVTAFCATVVSAPEDVMAHRLSVIAAARRGDARIRDAIPAVHLEGPHLSREDGARGAHALESLRDPDLGEFVRLQGAADGAIGIVTVAPELPGAVEYVRRLSLDGIVVSIGHTCATPGEVTRAADAGARLSTHLGNGTRAELPRHPNHLWEQLSDDRIAASFVADGHHLPAATLKAMIRAKGVERSILVSDSTMFAGMAPGSYESRLGGALELGRDRRLSIAGTPYLAGSAVGLLECVDGAVRHGGVTLGEALTMASANPRALLGRAGGVLRVGSRADVLVFTVDPETGRLSVVETLVGGQTRPGADPAAPGAGA